MWTAMNGAMGTGSGILAAIGAEDWLGSLGSLGSPGFFSWVSSVGRGSLLPGSFDAERLDPVGSSRGGFRADFFLSKSKRDNVGSFLDFLFGVRPEEWLRAGPPGSLLFKAPPAGSFFDSSIEDDPVVFLVRIVDFASIEAASTLLPASAEGSPGFWGRIEALRVGRIRFEGYLLTD